MRLERIYVGNDPAPMFDLIKMCLSHRITIHIHPNGGKPNLIINLQTSKREATMLPIFRNTGWKHYHYGPSTSIYKSVVFEGVIV